MSHATVSRALKTLKERRLIRLEETDFKRGNIWRISALALGTRGPDDQPPRDELPQKEKTQSEIATSSNRERGPLKSSTKVPRFEGNIRSIKIQKDIKKDPSHAIISTEHSFAELDEAIRNEAVKYFEELVPEKEKTVLIHNFSESEFPHGFLPPHKVIRNMAAVSWYKTAINVQASRA